LSNEVWDKNRKAGRREKRRRSSVSSEGDQTTKREAVEGAGTLYKEKCTGE